VSRAGAFTSRGGGRRLDRRRSASQPCHTRTDERSTCRRRRRRRRRDACLRSDSVHHLGKRRDARAGIAPTCDQAGSIDSTVEGVNAALRNPAARLYEIANDSSRSIKVARATVICDYSSFIIKSVSAQFRHNNARKLRLTIKRFDEIDST